MSRSLPEPSAGARATGAQPSARDMLAHWAVSALIYGVSLALLLLEARYGYAPLPGVLAVIGTSVVGLVLFLAAIASSVRRPWPAGWLHVVQCVFAITLTVACYALVGPRRELSVAILVVVLSFGVFGSNARTSPALCAYAIVLLGAAMVAMSRLQPERYPPRDEAINFVMAATLLSAVAYLAVRLGRLRRRMGRQRADLAAALERIRTLATRDELTGLVNRRHVHELLARDGARRDAPGISGISGTPGTPGTPVAVALLDLDHFKRINDTYGHAGGDAVLRDFATRAQGAIRASDTLARWGGEEFLLLMPDTGIAEATAVVERLRAQVALPGRASPHADPRVTCSAGVALSSPGEPIDAAIERADRALYRAKAAGRDRVVVG